MRKNARLAKVEDETNKVGLTPGKLNDLALHLNVMKDFDFTSLSNLRKLHKNYQTVADLVENLGKDERLIYDRFEAISKLEAEGLSPEEVKAMRDEAIAEHTKFGETKHTVDLYTMPVTDFPEEREKFDKKTIYQNNQPREVQYVTSYLELLGTVIID